MSPDPSEDDQTRLPSPSNPGPTATSLDASDPGLDDTDFEIVPPAGEFFGALGRYQVEREIARGGMGVILLAQDDELGRNVAIKLILKSHQDKVGLRRRFIEEARVTGQLQHPGIVPIYEMGQAPDGRPFFAMKLVKGQTLAELLTASGGSAWDRSRFLKVLEQVCQTLAYAHSQGVIHLDLKPANVMVGAVRRSARDGLGIVANQPRPRFRSLGCGSHRARGAFAARSDDGRTGDADQRHPRLHGPRTSSR